MFLASILKDIYLFLGVVNAIIATYSYFYVSDYENYYLKSLKPKVSFLLIPSGAGLGITKAF